MIKVFVPKFCVNEISYALSVVFSEFLEVEFSVEFYNQNAILIQTSDKTLKVDTSFFYQIKDCWLDKNSLNNIRLEYFDCSDLKINSHLVNLPVFFGNASVSEIEGEISINFDIFGFIFFMLSRYEEGVSDGEDSHSRFPEKESLMYKYGLTTRPTVNEYVEVFWYYITQCDSTVLRKNREYRNVISCDVDHPFDTRGLTIIGASKRAVINLVRHRNVRHLITDLIHYVLNLFKQCKRFDRYYNNLSYIMDVNDKNDNVVCFNFIPLRTHQKYDDDNRIDEEEILSVIEEIRERGHEVGFHPGYDTYKYPKTFIESATLFLNVFCERRKGQKRVGGRQHYLRFNILNSPKMWEDAGFDYDSSIGFSESIGFRAGVCFEYPMYDLVNRKKMKLRQVPLVSMEGSVLKRYAAKHHYSRDVLDELETLKGLVKLYSGDYTLLWHNSYFNKKDDFRLYEALIK